MVEKYEEESRGAGWVWAIVGVIVAALVVWWIAAAVTDGPEDNYADQTQNAPENVNAEQDSLAQNTPPTDEPGESDDLPPADSETSLESLNQWNEQEHATMDAAAVDDGTSRLSAAADEIALIFAGETPEEGSEMGGGPADEASQSLRSQRSQLESSVEQLKSAKINEYPETFHEVATDFVALADGIQNEANIEDASEPLEQLHEALGELSATQNLDEQKSTLEAFFDNGAEVLNKFAENTKATTE